MQAPGGVIAGLQSLLGLDVPFVIGIGCWLHVLSLALCHAIEETFGKASKNVCVSEIKNVTLLNLLFSTWWLGDGGMIPLEFVASMKVFAKMNSGHEIPTRRQEKPIFNKVGNQSLTPIHGSQKYWKLIEAWSLEMSQKHVGSSRKKLRETASYVNAWMKNGTLQMYSMCLEEFAVCLFRPEMEWAREATLGFLPGLQGALMARRIVQIQCKLQAMELSLGDYFPQNQSD